MQLTPEKEVMSLKIFGSSFTIFAVLLLGIYVIPQDFVYEENFKLAGDVLHAIGNQLVSHPLFTLSVWLLPIFPSLFLPLYVTKLPLSILSVIFGIICLSSLLFDDERRRLVHMLKAVPESGYMWHETLFILVVSFIVEPFSFYNILLGPVVCVTLGRLATSVKWYIFFILSLISMILILPVSHQFIQNDKFYLSGYTSDSIYGTILSIAFIGIWIRTYHIVCRDCYQTFVQSKQYTVTKMYVFRGFAIIWLLIGSALVEIWVSSAYILHFAYVSYLNIAIEDDSVSRSYEFYKEILMNIGLRCKVFSWKKK